MPAPGRKFLLAGRGGLNLTHGEPTGTFLARYPVLPATLREAVEAFPPAALRGWCEGLGQEVFQGSSGRIFPVAMKAAPLLRAWLRRLDGLGVVFRPRHRWLGWDEAGGLLFLTPGGQQAIWPDAVLLALGGASWPRMGSDGGWVPLLRGRGVEVRTLEASNCGVRIAWPQAFLQRHRGAPLKRIAIGCRGRTVRGEAVVTSEGLEGGAVYALSPEIRAGLAEGGAKLVLDLRPDLDEAALAVRLASPRRGRSLSNFLRQAVGLSPAAAGLVQVALHGGATGDLAGLIRNLPLPVIATQPIERAISSAGGVAFGSVDERLMLRAMPGVFVAGEMLDWEAPTGGYLLQACFSTGVAAAAGLLGWLADGESRARPISA
jgi:uncharacterized flavoprotein (TIGR03862 family)